MIKPTVYSSNLFAVKALLSKEISRFAKVWVQTILAPVISSLLFLIIFSYLLNNRLEPLPGIQYSAFLIPGLVMMTLQQNAFSNSSSSLTQSKITGNLIFLMLSPMTPVQWFAGYIGGAIARGFACGIFLWLFCSLLNYVPVASLLWVFTFSLLACLSMGSLGIIAGIYAEKWDQVSAFQNFLINPLTLLAGVFYSTQSLPPLWQTLSRFNPFFYLIDGFRYGFFLASDVSPYTSLIVCSIFTLFVCSLSIILISIRWRLKS